VAQRRRRNRAQPTPARCWRTWTRCRSSRRCTSATSTIENYFIGYLKHPYISLYTGRGCKSRCTFCLWPQTVGGHRYRTRSVGHVIEEIAWAQKAFPQVREFFFDDDTFTDDLPRTEAIARELGKLGVTWSCNAKANVPRATLAVMRDNGLRLLLVGYESGNQQILYNIKKGMRIEFARRFHEGLPRPRHHDPRDVHPRPARRDARNDRGDDTLRHRDQPPYDPGVAGGAVPRHVPVPAGARQRLARRRNADLVDAHGVQIAPLHYPHLSHTEIFDSVETFYRRFYFRSDKIASIVGEMVRSPQMMKRRLREGLEFFHFLRERRETAH
jgi:hypothetical protein